LFRQEYYCINYRVVYEASDNPSYQMLGQCSILFIVQSKLLIALLIFSHYV
jgi:hypothetical protein